MCRSWRFRCSPAFSEEAQVLEGCVVKGFARLHSAVQVAAARVSFHTPCLYSRGERRIKELPATPRKREKRSFCAPSEPRYLSAPSYLFKPPLGNFQTRTSIPG